MRGQQILSADTDERLDAIIAEYLEKVERGEASDPQAWLDQYPDFTEELALFFAAESRFDLIISPLRTASLGSAPTLSPDATTIHHRPFKTIKDYDLLEEIGRGGMGVIYKARQRSLNRLVAIKMIRSAEWATPAERMRFRWEAEAIAALDHPNIVPIYEIGEVASEDGAQLPFFSMKLIEGDNLAQCRGRFRNDWKAIARLLILVARAVDHAHQRGILHRDLKPANILFGCSAESSCQDDLAHGATVGGDNRLMPHISDFGLAAKVQQQRGQTVVGTVIGTPAYLAPELASGQATATMASDVYALGAILYELLAGEPPFRADTALETIRLLSTSSVTSPRKGNPAIPLDLETICLKCLQRNPHERYGSAGKLADDLKLFLAGRPISARPVGSFAAFRRWCFRQPVIAGLGAALCGCITVSLPLIIWNWRRAVEHEQIAQTRLEESLRERERADEAFEVAHHAFDDLFRMIGDQDAEELSESDALNKELLERGLKYYREFVDRRRDDPKMRTELASAMFRIANITQRIKTNREALVAFETTIEFLRSLLDRYPEDLSIVRLLSRSLTLRGRSLAQLDRLDEAMRSYIEAVEVWSRLPDGGAGIAEAQRGLGIAMLDRGVAFQNKGDWSEARNSYNRARDILLKCSEPGRVQGPLVHCYLNIAEVQKHFNQLDQAKQNAHTGKQIAENLFKQSPNSEETRLLMAQSHHTIAKIELKAGNVSGAKTALVSAQEFYEGLNRAKPRMKQFKRGLAGVYGELAEVEKQLKKPDDSLKALLRAATHYRELSESDGESRSDRDILGMVSFKIGEAYVEMKNYAAAAKAFEESRNQRLILSRLRPADTNLQVGLRRSCFHLGNSLLKLNKNSEALEAFEESSQIFRAVLQGNPENPRVRKDLASSLGNTAIVLRILSRPAEAIAATEERMKLFANNAEELYDTAIDFARTYDWLCAKMGSTDLKTRAVNCAIAALLQAREAGLPNLDRIRTDPAFAMMREVEEFKESVQKSAELGTRSAEQKK